MVIQTLVSVCLYTEEPRLATTPFIRPPLASAHLSQSFHPDVKISESFYYFEDLFNATTSVSRPGFYGPTLVASTGFHALYFLISVFHIVEQKKRAPAGLWKLM